MCVAVGLSPGHVSGGVVGQPLVIVLREDVDHIADHKL